MNGVGVVKLSYKKVVLTIVYSILFTIGLNLFIVPGGFISIGLMGVIQMLFDVLTEMGFDVSFGVLYALLNIPGLFISYKMIGRRFTWYTFISIITVSLFSEIIPTIGLTDEILMDVVFGGIIVGFSTGMILRIGGST
jgi:uncharacterized membrane-anchored protein YitT (DUF2179 family)